ncbi:MAG: crosslink repair DNA glycosylase YcaQ family protein [Woeseiaceae bacterium]|nr:crosslink repair DNA glycosylase YcaQ family protein [Woeseiaceae bacterium]
MRLSPAEARRIALAAQGFDRPRPGCAPDARHFRRVIDQLGLLQLDFVNVLVPAHYLVMFSRLGRYDRSRFDAHVHDSGNYTEQWAHEASIVPVTAWPLFAARRARWQPWKNNPLQKLPDRDEYLQQVLDTVRADGPLTAHDLSPQGGPKRRGNDWHRSLRRWALEYHFGRGDVTVVRRMPNFQRVYDVPERVIPEASLATGMTEADADRELVRRAARALGIGTLADIADYFRMTARDIAARVDELVEDGVLHPVAVDGWNAQAWVYADARLPRRIDGASLLSPFDPVVWFRPRAERLFDFHYRIEIYVPAAQRRWGYYVLPFRFGDDIVGRVDLKADRPAATLRVQHAWVEDDVDEARCAAALATELRELCAWLELEHVSVHRHNPFSNRLERELCQTQAA